MGMIDSLVVGLVSFVIGSFGILAGVRVIIDQDARFVYAAITALIGAVVWGVLSFFLSWASLVGVVVMLLAWVGVINYRYPGGWPSAAAVGGIAWAVSVVIVYLLSLMDLVAPDVLGIPGV